MRSDDDCARECWDIATLTDEKDGGLWAIASALFALSCATREAARHLGNGDAVTGGKGAIEAFGMHIGDKLDMLADALRDK